MSVLYKESKTMLKNVNVKHLHRTFRFTLHSSAEVNETSQNHSTKIHNLIVEVAINTLYHLNWIMPQNIISGVKDTSCFYYIILIY